jgi:gamma-glutamyltranspeptidase/glutathione hydrolase
VITMPPPSSGGIALAESLNILEHLEYRKVLKNNAGQARHYQVEALKHAFADRARWLGDSDFCEVPQELLTSESYARELAGRIASRSVKSLENYGVAQLPDDAGTSHFCIVDRDGNIVIGTETINTEFGSLAAVDEWGLILNNEMDDFAANPGKPNAYGLTQSICNAVAPGKRPLSSMSPTIVLKDDQPVLALGASGGPRIISSVLNVTLALTVGGESLASAMLKARPHHQWRPDQVFFDKEPPPDVSILAQWGHDISGVRKTGVVQAILREGNEWVGASDPRKGGRPAAARQHME